MESDKRDVRLLFALFLSLSTFLLGFTTTFYEVEGHPLRMRITSYGLIVVDSLNGSVKLLEDGKVLSEIKGFRFPVWADICCGGIYVSDIKSSRVALWKNGRISKRVRVPRPEMLKIEDGKIFVSSWKDVYVFDKNLKLLKKLSFPSPSVYFYIEGDKIVHLEYWGSHPDVTIANISGNYRESIDLGLSKPFRYEELDGKTIVLDYLGKLAVIKGGIKKVLRVGRFSYGMALSKNSIFVSSLVEKSIRKIDLKTLHQRVVKIPSPAGDIEYCCGNLVACGIFKDEVYVYDGKSIKTIRGCDYPLMVEADPPYVYVLCSDSSGVLRIDFSR